MITGADLLPLLEETAREAGALALSLQRRGVESWAKGDTTPVSDADLAVDALTKERLLAAHREFGWLSEETADNAERLSKDFVFVVDPIDGTRAFLKGKPEWVIALAVVFKGTPVTAAIFNPVTDEMFSAAQGKGTRLNGASVKVTNVSEVEGCRMIGFADMFRRPEWREPWPAMDIVQKNAVAYRMALVAAGLADATLSLSFKHEWDTAGGTLLIEEAGGCVSDHKGAPLAYNKPSPKGRSIIAANNALHGKIQARVGYIPDHLIASSS